MPLSLKSKIIIALLGPTIIGFVLIICIVALSLNAEEFKQLKNLALITKIESCLVYPAVDEITTNPIKIIDHVNAIHHGKWDDYIKKWEIYRNGVQSIIDSRVSSLSRLGITRLKDDSLSSHLIEVENRLNMIKCLQYINMSRTRKMNLNNY